MPQLNLSFTEGTGQQQQVVVRLPVLPIRFLAPWRLTSEVSHRPQPTPHHSSATSTLNQDSALPQPLPKPQRTSLSITLKLNLTLNLGPADPRSTSAIGVRRVCLNRSASSSLLPAKIRPRFVKL